MSKFKLVLSLLILILFFINNNNLDAKTIKNTLQQTNVKKVIKKPHPSFAPIPIINIAGFQKGDRYVVDGPLWYDGYATLEELNSQEMRINIIMAVPKVGIPYKIIDGKINVIIRLTKNTTYNLYLTDVYKNKTYLIPKVNLNTGKTLGGWFSSPKDYAKIVAYNQYYNFLINNDKTISISSNTMPGSLTLIKK